MVTCWCPVRNLVLALWTANQRHKSSPALGLRDSNTQNRPKPRQATQPVLCVHSTRRMSEPVWPRRASRCLSCAHYTPGVARAGSEGVPRRNQIRIQRRLLRVCGSHVEPVPAQPAARRLSVDLTQHPPKSVGQQLKPRPTSDRVGQPPDLVAGQPDVFDVRSHTGGCTTQRSAGPTTPTVWCGDECTGRYQRA